LQGQEWRTAAKWGTRGSEAVNTDHGIFPEIASMLTSSRQDTILKRDQFDISMECREYGCEGVPVNENMKAFQEGVSAGKDLCAKAARPDVFSCLWNKFPSRDV